MNGVNVSERVFGRKGFQEKSRAQITDFEEEQPENKSKVLYSTTSRFLFREINLFVPETIGLGIAVMGALMFGAFGIIFNQPMFMLIAAGLPCVIMVLFYMARLILFMPNKHRHVTHRILASGAIRSSVDDISSGKVPFDKKPLSAKITILNPKKHIDFVTGKPVLFFEEGAGENVSIGNGANTSQQAKQLDSVIDSIWGTAEAYTRYNIKKAEGQKDILIIIMVGITILLGIASVAVGFQTQQMIGDYVTNFNTFTQQMSPVVQHATEELARIATGSSGLSGGVS